MTPFIVAAPLVPDAWMSWTLIAFYCLFGSSLTPLAMLSVSGLSTSGIKGRVMAIYTLIIMIFGMSIGPQLTAFLTDIVYANEAHLSYAMSTTAAIVLPLSALFFWLSLKRYRDSVSRITVQTKDEQ